jgi:aminoglycoside 3-N-acetyltransferase I
MSSMQIRRLFPGDAGLAVQVFSMMASVFGEASDTLSLGYVEHLLRREDFWAIAAIVEREPVAGLTGFTLPLTRAESAELFIYDIAVQPKCQRRGIGSKLVNTLKFLAAESSIKTMWVAADNEDHHALDFYRAIGGSPMPVTIFTFPE